MKTHTIILNSRPNAKRKWPGVGQLARHFGSLDDDRTKHCCIGCEGLARGIPADAMTGCPFPDDVSSARATSWAAIWGTTVPKETAHEIRAAMPDDWQRSDDYHWSAATWAAELNDQVAPDDPEAAVAGIRILFRWLGETQNERWVVRWLR